MSEERDVLRGMGLSSFRPQLLRSIIPVLQIAGLFEALAFFDLTLLLRLLDMSWQIPAILEGFEAVRVIASGI